MQNGQFKKASAEKPGQTRQARAAQSSPIAHILAGKPNLATVLGSRQRPRLVPVVGVLAQTRYEILANPPP